MDKSKVLGGLTGESKAGAERLKIDTQASEGLEKRQIESVYAAYEHAVEKRAEVELALANVMHIFAGDTKQIPQDLHAVRAMRDVAIAAIELARTIAMKNGGAKK